MPSRQVKPFQFQNLPKLSRRQVDLQMAALAYLPDTLPPEIFTTQVKEILQKYMGERVNLEVTAIREPTFEQYCTSVPDPTVVFVLDCSPLAQKAFLQVDFALAHILVEKLLGGVGDYPVELRHVTPIEEGVLKFLILKILNLFAGAVAGSEVFFRLESFLSEPSGLKNLHAADDMVAMLSIQITIGKKAGFIRLVLPHPLVEGLAASLPRYERPLTEVQMSRLESLTDVKLPVWIELGRLNLEPAEVSRLESGDVVLVDEVYVELGPEGVTGPVTLRIQEGVGGGFKGQVTQSTDTHLEVQIDNSF